MATKHALEEMIRDAGARHDWENDDRESDPW